MAITRMAGGPSCGFFGGKHFDRRASKKLQTPFEAKSAIKARGRCYFGVKINRGELSCNNVIKCYGSISSQHPSDYVEINHAGVEERSRSVNGEALCKEIFESRETSTAGQSHSQNVQTELIMLSLPAIAGQAIEPLTQLMETAYVGRIDHPRGSEYTVVIIFLHCFGKIVT